MKNKKPAVVITSNLYKPNIGGVENSLYHLSIAYLELGYQPIIVTSDLTVGNVDLPYYESVDGIEIYRYRMNRTRFFEKLIPKTLIGMINAITLYRKINKEYSPQFLISRYHFNQLFAKLAGIKNCIYLVPGVVKYQNSSKNITQNNIRSQLQWRYHVILQYLALKMTDRVAVFSSNMIEQINLICKQNFTPLLTKPGVDGERFYPLMSSDKSNKRASINLNVNSKGKVFICVGRAVKAKGFDIVIDAFSQLSTNHNHLLIVGDGPLIVEYQQKAKRLGLTQNVHFLGAKSNPEVYYQLADFFIMSSIYEPLGQTILEALASGLPVLAFKPNDEVNTATLELMSEHHGVFVEKPSPDYLVASMNDVLSWTKEQYQQASEACREQVLNKFTWEKLAETLIHEFRFSNNDQPLVTVYIPTKNRLDLLKRAFFSVVNQTYKNIEIIVVDDGSTDGTALFLNNVKMKYKNIKVICIENSIGAPSARNLAINKAKGELITGLDDDDYFLPNRIANLVYHYDSKYAFVSSGYYWNYGKIKNKIRHKVGLISFDEQLHKNHVSNQVLTETKKLLSIGGFNTKYESCQDWDTWTRLIQKYGCGLLIKEIDYVVDVSHGNHRISDNPKRVSGFLRFKNNYLNLMSKSHAKSMNFQIAVSSGMYLTLIDTLKLMTWPLIDRNIKYWLSCRFPNFTKNRLNKLK